MVMSFIIKIPSLLMLFLCLLKMRAQPVCPGGTKEEVGTKREAEKAGSFCP